MASVVVEKAEQEQVLAFASGGRPGFDFWRMQIQSILLIGGFCLLSIRVQDRKPELHSVYFGMLLIGTGYSILETVRLLWKNRRDSRLFLERQGFIDPSGSEHDRFFTGTQQSSPLYGGIRTEFIMLIVTALAVWPIFNREMQTSGLIHSNALTILGFTCWGGMCLLSIATIVLSLIRPAKKSEVVILPHGILYLNRGPDWFEKLPNEFFPWSCIEQAVADNGSPWRNRTLQIDVDRWPWYRTIPFVGIRDDDWERMLATIGDRVKVVREEKG